MDAAIVGKFLGINALASVGASTSVVFLILGFCNGCCGGFGIPVAQKFGARDYGMMQRRLLFVKMMEIFIHIRCINSYVQTHLQQFGNVQLLNQVKELIVAM